MIFVLIDDERLYQPIKHYLNQNVPIASQIVKKRTISRRKDNNSIISNILRQINVKLGGDLWHLSYALDFIKKSTMVVGIDVCHHYEESIIGFCASYDKFFSKFYSQIAY